MSSASLTTYTLPFGSLYIVDIKNLHGSIFSDLTERGIQKTLNQGKSVVVFINKKGAYTGMVCKECGHIPYCKNCDVPIGLYHNNHEKLFGLCPICQETYQIISSCPSCGKDSMQPYGIGIQQAAQYCTSRFVVPVITIQSSNANSHKKIDTLFQSLKHTPSIIIATSLIQFPVMEDIGMLVIQNAIQANIPDYNTEYHNYLFLYTCIHSYHTPHTILQTYQPDHLIIQSLATNNPSLFHEHDTSFRQKHNYPPYGELCILSYKHPVEKSLFTKVNNLFHDILALRQKEEYNQIEVYAIPAMIYKIYGKYRYQIIIKGASIRSFTDLIFSELKPFQKGFKFDRGAQSFF